jgi:hypothetical protein
VLIGSGDIDFAALATALTPAQKALVPDGEGVPTIGYGILPVYNVRCQFLPWVPLSLGSGRSPAAAHTHTQISELVDKDPLILDWQAISDILLNKITVLPTCLPAVAPSLAS